MTHSEFSVTRIAVVGRGSAAARTLGVLRDFDVSGIVNVASEPVEGFEQGHLSSLESIHPGDVDWVFDCSPASQRVNHARVLSERGFPTIFEKPLAMTSEEGKLVLDCYAKAGVPLKVGYNLRSLQAFGFVGEVLDGLSIGGLRNAEISVGQYLPDWRPGRDYRSTVSAQQSLGGGVLLELSHEINYAIGLWGRVQKIEGETRHSGDLEIDAEDWAQGTVLFESHPEAAGVTLTLDFLRRTPERWCRIFGHEGEIMWNLLKNEVTVSTSSGDTLHQFDDSLDETYRKDIGDLLLSGSLPPDSTHANADALHTLEAIDAWRLSSHSGRGADVKRVSRRA